MKLTCLQENLARGLGVVSKAISAKSPFPILSNVLLSAKDGRFKVVATDLETSITTYVGASIEKEGVITVPAKLLRDFVGHLPPDTVSMDLVKDIVYISVGNTKAKMNGIVAKDFPTVPCMEKDTDFLEIAPDDFARAVGVVAFAAAMDNSRPVFSGILLSFEEGALTLVASDGFRLSEKLLSTKSSIDPFSVVVPSKTLLETARIFASSEEPVKVALGEEGNLVLFESEDTLVTTRVLDGQFPDYKRIIPTEAGLTAELEAQELLEAVRLASVFAQDEGSSIKLTFDPKGNVHVSSSSQESGEHTSAFEASIEGDELEVVVNSKYLLDFLSNAKAERVVFETKGVSSPCLLKPVEHKDFLHIIMPMQTQK